MTFKNNTFPSFVPDNTAKCLSEPIQCKAESAELCVLSSSFVVSDSGTKIATTNTAISSVCSTVYSCDIEGTTKDASRAMLAVYTGTYLVRTYPIALETKLAALDQKATADAHAITDHSTIDESTSTTAGEKPNTSAEATENLYRREGGNLLMSAHITAKLTQGRRMTYATCMSRYLTKQSFK